MGYRGRLRPRPLRFLPKPRIVGGSAREVGFHGIPSHVIELLLKISIRTNPVIEVLLTPYRSSAVQESIDRVRRGALYAAHDLGKPEWIPQHVFKRSEK